ncbi:MAG TPA: SMI1/KNR4 family protein [Pyrinomonadaceae bacterium]|nr:SMI1/KNR4 family protein [Pyrinomonadaceae bacterium]
MTLENIKIIDPYVEKGWTAELRLTLAAPDEVDNVEADLNVSFPAGYKEYVTTLGLGEYCNYIRIDMPRAILSGCKEHQQTLDDYWFWEMGEDLLSKEKAIESIKIGDTVDGDVIIFHPSNSEELFVLPRHDDMLHKIGSNLYEAIDWLCVYRHNPHSGSVGETHVQRYFVPYNPFGYTHGVLRPENI